MQELPKIEPFRWKRPCALLKFVFCHTIFKNGLYMQPRNSWISRIHRFYPVHLLDYSICSCVAYFRRELAPEVDANQSHKSLRTPLRRNEVHQPWDVTHNCNGRPIIARRVVSFAINEFPNHNLFANTIKQLRHWNRASIHCKTSYLKISHISWTL